MKNDYLVTSTLFIAKFSVMLGHSMMQNVSKLNPVYAKLHYHSCVKYTTIYEALSISHFKRTIFYTVNLIASYLFMINFVCTRQIQEAQFIRAPWAHWRHDL